MIKKTLALFICIIMICCLFTGCSKKGKTIIYDNGGKIIATVTDLDSVNSELKDGEKRFFVEYAISEAVEIIKSTNKCNDKEAKAILRKEASIYTTLDENILKQIKNHYNDSNIGKTELGCAVTDTNGTLLAIFSNKDENYATKKQNPHSAFKPLSVYAPALDKGIINWSTVFDDSPYKKVNTDNKGMRDWPANADGKYSMKKVCVCDAIAKSLNTVAVKVLAEYGVMNSVEFLQSNFGLSLEEELKRASVKDEDEIIGNIALGSISEGCSPVDMAGYYQIFTNGGNYAKPHSITKITDKNGKEIFNYKQESKRVIKETTAYIMNKMLQNVVTAVDGTGKDARIRGALVGGKTGTGDKNDGNWFVGFTPEYVCSVWHGKGLTKNTSPAVFSAIMTAVTENSQSKTAKFPSVSGVSQQAYCKESGKMLKYSCHTMDVGFYTADNIPQICDIH